MLRVCRNAGVWGCSIPWQRDPHTAFTIRWITFMQCSVFYRGKVKKGERCKVCVWGLTTIKFWEPWHWLCFSFILLKCLDKQRTNVLRIVYTFFYFSILGNSLTQPIAFCVRQAVPIHGHRNISSEREGIQREMFYFRPCVPPLLILLLLLLCALTAWGATQLWREWAEGVGVPMLSWPSPSGGESQLGLHT